MALSIAYNMDCMEAMRSMPDECFDLAVVDPPYGIGNKFRGGDNGKLQFNEICKKGWDKAPNSEYFEELQRVSKNQNAKIIKDIYTKGENKIHPTQKPVALYAWIFSRYAKPGDKILDTHLGSGSSRIAAYDAGLDFVGCEIDKDYFEAQERRFAAHTAQVNLFLQEE